MILAISRYDRLPSICLLGEASVPISGPWFYCLFLIIEFGDFFTRRGYESYVKYFLPAGGLSSHPPN